MLSGVIFSNRNGLQRRDAPAEHGPPKSLDDRRVRWRRMGDFARMMEVPASEGGGEQLVMIDATCLTAHRTASNLRANRGGPTTNAGA